MTDSTWSVDISPERFVLWCGVHIGGLVALFVAAIWGVGWWACIPFASALYSATKILLMFSAVLELTSGLAVKYLEGRTEPT